MRLEVVFGAEARFPLAAYDADELRNVADVAWPVPYGDCLPTGPVISMSLGQAKLQSRRPLYGFNPDAATSPIDLESPMRKRIHLHCPSLYHRQRICELEYRDRIVDKRALII